MLTLLMLSTLLGYKNVNRCVTNDTTFRDNNVNLLKVPTTLFLVYEPSINSVVLCLFIYLVSNTGHNKSDLVVIYPVTFALVWIVLNTCNGLVDSIISIEIVSLAMTILMITYGIKTSSNTKSLNNMANMLTFNLLAYVILLLTVFMLFMSPSIGSWHTAGTLPRTSVSIYFLIKFGFIVVSITKESAYSGLPLRIIWVLTSIGMVIMPVLISPILHSVGTTRLLFIGVIAVHISGLWLLLQIRSKRQLVLYTTPNSNANAFILAVI